nr:hypothetical protein [Vibrio alginolyticus]
MLKSPTWETFHSETSVAVLLRVNFLKIKIATNLLIYIDKKVFLPKSPTWETFHSETSVAVLLRVNFLKIKIAPNQLKDIDK